MAHGIEDKVTVFSYKQNQFWFMVIRALGRLDDIAWLGNLAGQSAMRVVGVHALHGHLYGHTCHSSCFTRVAHMCHDMTGPAIMAGRLDARTFCLPLAGIACHGLIA